MTKTNNITRRGKQPKESDKLMLIARAGGRCQFEGCNKKLFEDTTTMKKINFANFAHVIASSPDGPRGNEQSHKLSDNIENIMLLCPEHHKLIDTCPEEYPAEVLYEMKEIQESMVDDLLDCMYFKDAMILMLQANIKNSVRVNVDFKDAVKAIRKDKLKSANSRGIKIDLKCEYDYRSENYWKYIELQLESEFKRNVEDEYRYNRELILTVFPLAPIPLIIKLGNMLGDKQNVNIYQKTRSPETWNWLSNDLNNSFTHERTELSNGNKIALVISLTACIDLQRVKDAFDADIIYHIKAEKNGVECIKSQQDLKAFWIEYQKVCDLIKNEDCVSEVSLFPAMPVSAAFEVGRRTMPGVYPIMHIYDECNGFFKTITVGG